ncbi:MAG: hypothetical protein Kow00108_16040 [Calditrichia bacterium]
MRYYKKILLMICLFSGLFAQSGDGQYGVRSIIDEASLGVQSLGMGGAYVSIADNAAALYWNPAGLDYLNQINLMLFHASYYEGSLFDFASVIYPTLNLGTVGIGYGRFGTADINRYDANGVFLGSTDFASEEIYLSYGKTLPYNFALGTTFKIARQQTGINNSNSAGLGLDVGIIWRSQPGESILLTGWSIGVKLHNLIEPKLRLGSEVDSYPSEYRFGISKIIPLGLSNALQFSMDYYKNDFMDADIRYGARFNFKNFTNLSVGMLNNNLMAGAGIKYKFIKFDYVFGNQSYQSFFGSVHRFSITFKLGLTREQMLQIAEKKRREREQKLVEQTREAERLKFVQRHLELGQQYFKEQKYLDAYVEFQQVLSEDPFNKEAKAMLEKADAMIQAELQNQQQQAVSEAVDKVLAEETQNFIKEHYEKGRFLLEKKRYTEALIEFNLALNRDPNNQLVKSAIRTAQNQLRIEVQRLVNRGREEYSKGNFAEALSILNDALVIAPEDPALKREIQNLSNSIKVQQYVQEGLIFYDLGQYDNALNSFEEALKLDPGNTVIKTYLEKAKSTTQVKVEKMDPESEKEYLMGVDLFLAGKYDEALSIWLKLKERYPYNKKVLDAIRSAEERIKRLRK